MHVFVCFAVLCNKEGFCVCSSGRNSRRPPQAYLILAGAEPLTFTNIFPYWEKKSDIKVQVLFTTHSFHCGFHHAFGLRLFSWCNVLMHAMGCLSCMNERVLEFSNSLFFVKHEWYIFKNISVTLLYNGSELECH